MTIGSVMTDRRGWRCAAVAAGIMTVALAACSSSAGSTQTVKALWYGKQSDGSIQHGITPVTVGTSRSSSDSVGNFSIDLSGMNDAGTGAYWNAAAASAAVVGTLGAAVDPRNLSVNFAVNESIDGPSAGGLMTVAVASDLANQQVQSDRSMTGTIMPDGSLGPVGGIPEKVRAAAEAGLKTIVIPAGQKMSVDPTTGSTVDVVQEGQQLGVTVIEAGSTLEAYQAIVGDPANSVAQADPGALNPGLLTLLSDQAQKSLKALAQTPVKNPGGQAEAYTRFSQSVKDGQKIAEESLASDPVKAYAAASQTLRVLLGWNAAVDAKAAATRDLSGTATALIAQANQLQSTTVSAIETSASTQLTHLEQVPALVDSLSWGTDAWATAKTAVTDLQAASTPAAVGQEASQLAKAQYDVQSYLPVAVQATTTIGNKPLPDATAAWSFIAGYGELLAKAAQANMDYYQQASKNASDSSNPDVAFSKSLLTRLDAVKGAGATSQQQAIAVSTALSAYIATSLQVTGLGVIAANNVQDVSASDVTILKDQAFGQQAKSATTIGAGQARVLAGAQLDSSYVRWGNQWGALMSEAPDSMLIADQVRREGLSYQWFSNIDAKMLTALSRGTSG